jgi:hypothetical protein
MKFFLLILATLFATTMAFPAPDAEVDAVAVAKKPTVTKAPTPRKLFESY